MKNFLINIINKFYKWIDTISKDEVLHSYVSTIIANIIFIICFANGISAWLSLGLSVIITILIGLFKEYVIDLWLRKTQVEMKDLKADTFGIIVGSIINILIIILCH